MTATAGTFADYSRGFELLKRVYADKVEDLVPESDVIAKKVPFISADKQNGQDYFQPVTLSRSGGYTWWNDGSVKTLNQPLAPEEVSASIRGSEFVNRIAISYKFMQAALKALGDGRSEASRRAFVNATKDQFSKMAKGTSYARECALLYGGGTTPGSTVATFGGLGVILSKTGSSGTTLVVQVEPKHWAAAIWAGSKGLEFDIHAPGGTKRNTAGTTTDTVYKQTAVNVALKQVTFTSHATNVTAAAIGDIITFAGSRTQDMLGFLHAALTPAGTTLWNISTDNELWKPQVKAVNGALTLEVILDGMADLSNIGFDGDIDLMVSPKTFQSILNDQSALVSHSSGKTSGSLTLGFTDVTFKSPAGTVHLHVHKYMKEGYALGLPRDYCMRVGSTDITHTMPNFGKMFRELENAAGVEMRHYFDQAPFCKHASYMIVFTDIINPST